MLLNTIYIIIFPYILIFQPSQALGTFKDTRLSGLTSQYSLLPAKPRLSLVLRNTPSIAHAVALAATHPTFLCLANSYSILQE